jgi:hypothetical protein
MLPRAFADLVGNNSWNPASLLIPRDWDVRPGTHYNGGMASSMSADVPAGLDPVLEPFVSAQDEESARGELGRVFEAHVLPIVRGVVRRELAWGTGRGASEADLEDVVGTVIVRLTACLMRTARERKWEDRRQAIDAEGYGASDRRVGREVGDRAESGASDGADGEPIGNVRAYAGQITANACAEWLRARYPLRARLTAQIRYACRHHRELALWWWCERVWLCGLAAWRDVRDPVDSDVLAALRGRLAAPLPSVASEAKRIVTALFAVLREVDGPCRLGEAVTVVADLLGIPERMNAGTGTGVGAGTAADDEPHAAMRVAPAIDRQLEQRDFLARVWSEVRALPIRQRVALLLNLRDEGQQDALTLITTADVATHDELSACIGLSPVELTALLPDLPQDDLAIATRLGVTRRQVINLRKCARERLARRLGFLRGASRSGEGS